MFEQQKQQAGDNSQQIQVDNLVICTGIDEKRAREIVDEKLREVITSYSQEAHAVAEHRINLFANDLIPKLVKDNLLDELKDPSIQILLAEAQKTAASTEREADYSLLSELLIRRVRKGKDRNIRAGIARAIEIVDKISDEALLGLTVAYVFSTFSPNSGDIESGIQILAELCKNVTYSNLPTGKLWIDNLEILNAIRVNDMQTFKKSAEFLSFKLNNYVDIGIEKNTENYYKAIAFLKDSSLPPYLLCDHKLRQNFVRLNTPRVSQDKISYDGAFSSFNSTGEYVVQHSPIILSQNQEVVVRSIYQLYKIDDVMRTENISRFMELCDRHGSLRIVRQWWDALPIFFSINSVGKSIAHANAQKCYPMLPVFDQIE